MRVIDEWENVEGEGGTKETTGTNERVGRTDERTGGGAGVVWSKETVAESCKHEAIERDYESRNQARGATDTAGDGHEAMREGDGSDGSDRPRPEGVPSAVAYLPKSFRVRARDGRGR